MHMEFAGAQTEAGHTLSNLLHRHMDLVCAPTVVCGGHTITYSTQPSTHGHGRQL